MTETQTQVPPMIVDRSPELIRNARYSSKQYSSPVVTVPDEENCVRGDGSSCIVAVMIKNILGPDWEPHIEGEHPYVISPDGTECPLTLSPDLVDAIGRFDRGEPDAFKNMRIHFTWDYD